jgi:hypothetical protein
MEFIEYTILIVILSSVTLLGIGLFRKNPYKARTKKTVEDIASESFGTLGGINEQLRKEIKSLQGQKQRLHQKVNELAGMEEAEPEEREVKPDITAITQAVKSIMPNATEFQIQAALNIPQVKELLGNGKNLQLITELLPLLKAGNNSNGYDQSTQGNQAMPFA